MSLLQGINVRIGEIPKLKRLTIAPLRFSGEEIVLGRSGRDGAERVEVCARPRDPHLRPSPQGGEEEKSYPAAASFAGLASALGGANTAINGRLMAIWRVGSEICAPSRSVT